MNQLVLKTAVSLLAMIALLVMALITYDVIYSELFASFAIIVGVYSSKQLSNKNK